MYIQYGISNSNAYFYFLHSVENLRGEWKKLQDSHRQAMLRRKTRSGQGAKNMKPWKYEALMSFLLSDLTARE